MRSGAFPGRSSGVGQLNNWSGNDRLVSKALKVGTFLGNQLLAGIDLSGGTDR